MIILETNRGYKWTCKDGVYFKGYFIKKGDSNLHVFKEEEACLEFKNLSSFREFVAFLKLMEGSYSVVLEKSEATWLGTDIARSMPLFYSTDGHYVSDSAECIRKKMGIAKESVDKDNIVELYANYYLFGEKTVYAEIKQLDLGEATEIKDGTINKKRYFEHLNDIENLEVNDLRKKIKDAAYNSFRRLKAVIGNRPVVLSMSGGYDSRFVGCMLKNIGIEDVSCYTYGKLDSFEVLQSKKNAEALGFRWVCVEMTDELQSRNLDEIGQAYFNYYTGHDFTAYMQNFTAVRKLHEDGWFNPNSVFLTGLCGDMPTGEYAVKYSSNFSYNIDTAVDDIYKKAFTRFTTQTAFTSKWKNEIRNRLKELPIEIKDYVKWNQAVDCIYTGMCHSHWYMHMNSAHSFFGYEWLLPYWDKELLMAWYSVPPELKVKQKFYEDWLMEDICKPFGISQKKTIVQNSENPRLRKLLYFVGGFVNYVYLHLGRPFKRKNDYSNFAPLSLVLYKGIKSKKCINYRRSGMMQLLCQYLIEQRYGEENLKYACNHTESRE